ncbi:MULTISPECIES: cell division protein FtsB [Photobacterium]|uniref:Cell division protein FtsB n=1 Tax=Photobacterium ganghwense TaxID=320778 RepID=A0A0J1H432_9GAMM|nr:MULTISPECIES: cell division protein FtsB [Photobacterium]KLV06515.1 cell division protein FtsB [Photobacterium ganghwense]MBV1840382.1 cell division protein FtsB [Photobacterium ganghwense]PSU06600.1 cell division protein FtsB [Photobacterium ganghwense]QSV14560.1 cell division protein FtsB [Photobacterium ganghwense]
MRLFTLLLLMVLGWLQYDFWLGKNGMMDYLAVRDNVVLQKQANAELQQRNQQMYVEIHDLNRGQEAIEERARNELGMLRPGETFFRIVSP